MSENITYAGFDEGPIVQLASQSSLLSLNRDGLIGKLVPADIRIYDTLKDTEMQLSPELRIQWLN